MAKIIDLSGKGSAISGAENDANLSTLSGINVVEPTTSRTVDIDDQGATIEFTNAGAIAVTLDSMATIAAALHTDDFTVTLLATGAGAVTITPNGLNTINSGVLTIVLATDEYVTLQTDSTQLIWNIVNSNADVATKTGTETLTNKTLTTPTLTSPVINTGVSGTAFLDEDDLSSDSATKLASQQSIKAYVDAVDTTVTARTADLNTKIINIGDWDMDATVAVTVAHGVTHTKIRSISVIIRDDSDGFYHDFPIYDVSGTTVSRATADATNISLNRSTSGIFDNTSFNSTSYNRGWVTIQYTD